jgi:hypothetical protein
MATRKRTTEQTATQKTKDQAPLKTGDEFKYSRRIGSSCSTSGTYCVTLVTNPVISYEWG